MWHVAIQNKQCQSKPHHQLPHARTTIFRRPLQCHCSHASFTWNTWNRSLHRSQQKADPTNSHHIQSNWPRVPWQSSQQCKNGATTKSQHGEHSGQFFFFTVTLVNWTVSSTSSVSWLRTVIPTWMRFSPGCGGTAKPMSLCQQSGEPWIVRVIHWKRY